MIVRNWDAKKDWTGAIVCLDCAEPRHPQDYVRGKADNQAARGLVQPEISIGETAVSCSESAIAGIAVAGCAVAGIEVQLIPDSSFNTADPLGS